jgi:hypothetical protein
MCQSATYKSNGDRAAQSRAHVRVKYEAGRKHYGFLTASFLKLILG